MKTLDELRDLAIRWALDYISHHQAQSRVNLDGIGSGLATAQRFEEESKRALDDALRELIADAERYRWLRESRDDGFWKCHEKDGEGGSILKYGVDLDSAIDAARESV